MKKIFLILLFTSGLFNAFAQEETPIVTIHTDLAQSDTMRLIIRAMQDASIDIDYGDGKLQKVVIGDYLVFPKGAIGKDKIVKIYGNPTQISVFSIYDAKITNIDVSKLTEIFCLGLGGNSLSTLDLSHNINLEELNIFGNKFTEIDVSMLPELWLFNCVNNRISALNIANNTKLSVFYCSQNKLNNIDLSKHDSLRVFHCDENNLNTLDVSTNMNLKELCCSDNKLTNLDISKNKGITYLSCMKNYLNFGTLPLFKPTISTSYKYDPQKDVLLSDTTAYVDFSAGYEIEGFKTSYIWRTTKGKTLIKGIDYELNNGITTFLKEGLEVFCELSNEAFPLLVGNNALKTTNTITKVHNIANDAEKVLENVRIYSSSNQLIVNAPVGSEINVYDGIGRKINHKISHESTTSIYLNKSGLYIVRLCNQGKIFTQKVIIK